MWVIATGHTLSTIIDMRCHARLDVSADKTRYYAVTDYSLSTADGVRQINNKKRALCNTRLSSATNCH